MIQIGPVIEIVWQIVDFCIVNSAHLEKWRPFCYIYARKGTNT